MKRLKLPLMLVMLVFISSVIYHIYILKDVHIIFSMESPFTLSAMILAFSFFLLKLADVTLWTPARRNGHITTPRLFIDLLNALILLIVTLIIVSKIFNKPINGILAASGALGVIIGLSMQRMMADIFTGVAINVDNTVQLNDWIEYSNGGSLPIIGQVKEINWRTIKLLTYDNDFLIIPNGDLATNSIRNLSSPSSKSMFSVNLNLDFEVPTSRVLTLLEAAVISVPEVLEQPRPSVFVSSVNERGVDYTVRFWLDIKKVNINLGKHLVYTSALKHIHQSGLSLSYSKHDIYHRPMPKRHLDRHRDIGPLLRRVPLFKMLTDRELFLIHSGIVERTVTAGKTVVRSGSAGSSMFIVVEGVLNVIVEKVNNNIIRKVKVNQLTPGDFFGEMSLLTGEPRSATIEARTDSILYEVKKKSMMRILKERPEIGKHLSRILAERVMSNKSIKLKYGDNKKRIASNLFTRMKEFFFGV